MGVVKGVPVLPALILSYTHQIQKMLTLSFKLIEEMYHRCIPLDQVLPMAWEFQDTLGKDVANEFIMQTRKLNN